MDNNLPMEDHNNMAQLPNNRLMEAPRLHTEQDHHNNMEVKVILKEMVKLDMEHHRVWRTNNSADKGRLIKEVNRPYPTEAIHIMDTPTIMDNMVQGDRLRDMDNNRAGGGSRFGVGFFAGIWAEYSGFMRVLGLVMVQLDG
jgi:hypothetical protein